MPAGLEEKVTHAMRERGFLEKRRRTIALTNGRMAGLVAACVALVIGGYSIGLYRGGGSGVLPVTPAIEVRNDGHALGSSNAALEKKEEAPRNAPVEQPVAAEPPAAQSTPEKDAPTQSAPVDAVKPDVASGARSDERFRQVEFDEDRPAQALQAEPAPATVPTLEAPVREKSAAKAMRDESARRVQAQPSTMSPQASKPSLTYMLNGTPVVIDAPDSVRVTQDERGRMLIIYTSDGIIRIRMADDR
jgi:hypothetical protein